MAQITQGLVSVTNGSEIVSGTGTSWLDDVEPTNEFTVAADGVLYTIASVDSDTQITLSAPYAGDTATDVPYAIVRDFTQDGFALLNQGDIETATVFTRSMQRIQTRFNQVVDAEQEVQEHSDKVGGVHGVPNGEEVEWKTSSQEKVDTHSNLLGDVHGVPNGEEVEWKSSAQLKVDEAEDQRKFRQELLERIERDATLNLNFAENRYSIYEGLAEGNTLKPYSEIVTHTRASAAGGFNALGNFETVTDDIQRLVYSPETGRSLGLLVEGEATNNAEFSEPTTLSQLRVSGGVVIAENSFFGFDGAVQFGDNTEDRFAYVERAPGEYNVSFFVQMDDLSEPRVRRLDVGEHDLQVVIGGNSASSSAIIKKTPVGNSVWRIDCSDTAIGDGNNSGVIKTSSQTDKPFVVSGFQTTSGTQASSYIKTTGTSATRAPDVVSVGEWLNAGGFTFILQNNDLKKASIAALSLGSAGDNRVSVYNNGVNVALLIRLAGGMLVPNAISIAGNITGENKIVVTSSGFNWVMAVNGVVGTYTYNSAEVLGFTQASFSNLSGSITDQTVGEFKALPYALTEAEAIEASKL